MRGRILAIGCIVLAAWSVADAMRDRILRRRGEDLARRASLDRLRPLEIAAMRLEPTVDGAWFVVADAARGAGRPTDLAAARDLMLNAVARRPGSARHRLLLGDIAFTAERLLPVARQQPGRWHVPMSAAASAAPGLDAAWTSLASADLEAWPTLPGDIRATVPGALRRAFLDPVFVGRAFLPATRILGKEETVRLLPDASQSLRAAAQALAEDRDVRSLEPLLPRIEATSRAERDALLKQIEQRRGFGDLDGARAVCVTMFREYPIREFDDAAGRKQTARLLELWPNDIGGSWRTDDRGELVRFFLNRRQADVNGISLLSATEALSGVPELAVANARLLSGDFDGAENVMAASATAGSLEWAPFVVSLAHRRANAGDPKGARAALDRLPASARDGCDALLGRRDLAQRIGDSIEVEAAGDLLLREFREEYPPTAWSRANTLSLCLDPKLTAGRALRVDIHAEAPALVAFGWNDGRSGLALVPGGDSVLAIPLEQGRVGRQNLSVGLESGGPVRLGSVRIAESPPERS
jgi:hypothetical protein